MTNEELKQAYREGADNHGDGYLQRAYSLYMSIEDYVCCQLVKEVADERGFTIDHNKNIENVLEELIDEIKNVEAAKNIINKLGM